VLAIYVVDPRSHFDILWTVPRENRRETLVASIILARMRALTAQRTHFVYRLAAPDVDWTKLCSVSPNGVVTMETPS
jgi:hypothetical protein